MGFPICGWVCWLRIGIGEEEKKSSKRKEKKTKQKKNLYYGEKRKTEKPCLLLEWGRIFRESTVANKN